MNELITSTHPQVSIDAAGLVASFLSGKNALTLKAYSRDLAHFTKFVGCSELVDAAKLLLLKNQGQANALAISYKNQLIDEGRAPATINRRLAALKSLVKMARVVGLCSFTLEVSGIEAETLRDTRGPGKEGVDKLLKMVEKGTDKKSKRDLAMLHLLYGMALRRGEVCSLNLEHVEKTEGALWIMGKSRKQRQRITMPDKARAGVTAAARFFATSTASAPTTSADRATAPRFPGSVTWSSAMMSEWGLARASAITVSSNAYGYGSASAMTPWCAPRSDILSISRLLTRSTLTPVLSARRTMSSTVRSG